VKAPDATFLADVIVVFASFRLERLSQVAADAGIAVSAAQIATNIIRLLFIIFTSFR
jgi:hypothetical protein